MRLMIIGSLEGHISEAGKIALRKGVQVSHVENIAQAMNALRNGKGADLIMIDVKLDVAELITSLETERMSIPVVACGIGTDATAAVQAIKAGAKEYVPLPPNAELIAAVLEAVAEENTSMIADAPAMRRVIEMADQIAPSTATVLITGESGTGKEVMGHYIHQKSNRKDGVFVSLNCAAIPENLLESELFGHEKGAFTGAVARRLGKFEEASGGTLFLDEISEMDISLQAKLLRAIQEKEITRIGSNKPIKVDIRMVATTNRDLEKEVKAGTFREDLFFRLNVINLNLPPLRERRSDIPKMTQFFITKFCEQNGLPEKIISEDAMDKLIHHHWKGNVRELENTIHRAVLISGPKTIEADAILLTGGINVAAIAKSSTDVKTQEREVSAVSSRGSVEMPKVGQTVADMERNLILETLEHCLGNRTHAANILGISIRTLRNKLKQYSDAGIAIPASGE